MCVPVPPHPREGLPVPVLHRQGKGEVLPLTVLPTLPVTLPLPHLDTVLVGHWLPDPLPQPPRPPRLPVRLPELVLDTDMLLHPELVMEVVGGREAEKAMEVDGNRV